MNAEHRVVDIYEHFIKQTHRNRTRILAAAGPLNLIIPVGKSSTGHIRDVPVSYAENWQAKHWQAIRSAYNNSPYFEHYEDDFRTVFMQKTTWLTEYNEQLWQWMWKQLDIEPDYHFSEAYVVTTEPDLRLTDFSKPMQDIDFKPYKQVFSPRLGFQPNLSIIDLLFNKGPEAMIYISEHR